MASTSFNHDMICHSIYSCFNVYFFGLQVLCFSFIIREVMDVRSSVIGDLHNFW